MRLKRSAAALVALALCACSARRDPPRFTDASWRPFDRGLPASGQWRQGFAIADLDGDGNLDLAHGALRHGHRRPALFRGDGRGTWQRWREASFPDLGYDFGDVAAADLDADGHLDLAFAMHQRGVAILRGDGGGHFTHWSRDLPLGAEAFATRAVAVVDWNGDGLPDLAAYGQGPRLGGTASRGVRILLNGGNGTWRTLDPLPGMSNFGDSIAVGDFDADGRDDLAIASSRLGADEIVLRRANADTLTALALPLAGRPYVRAVAAVAGETGQRAGHDLVVAYLALDDVPAGAPGVARAQENGGPTTAPRARREGDRPSSEAGNWSAHLDLYRWRGGVWERRALLAKDTAPDVTAVDAIRIGDTVAIAALAADGGVVLLHVDAATSSTLVLDESLAPRDGCRGRAVALRDLDGDGRVEIVAAFAGAPSDTAPEACRSRGRLRVWQQY